jgi:flagellar export protein FliJ
MSALDSLIRLHRWQLDERRRQLAELETLAEKLRQEGARLVAEQASEQTVAAASTEAATAYGSYAAHLVERRRKLEQSLTSVEQQLILARDALSESYREVKRYEIAAATRAAQQRKRSARQQQNALDEVAIETFRRRTRSA